MRMIERWFPCAEVSEQSQSGWGSGRSEKGLFTWFATRPLAQAKAAVLTSLLPWPEEPSEQTRLQNLVQRAMSGRDEAWGEVVRELEAHYPKGLSLLDPFSGRGVIPLEAARVGVRAYGIDYSPVATLAGQLLADYPLRDWESESPIPFGTSSALSLGSRLLSDVQAVLDEVGRRYEKAMDAYYPKYEDRQPWGYLWAVTLPCQECGRRFPLTGSLVLRHPLPRDGDLGQSYRIEVDRANNTFQAVVHEGPPTQQPTLAPMTQRGRAVRGKAAICPFCHHAHPQSLHMRLAAEGLGSDVLLLAADLDDSVGKLFRQPTQTEREAVVNAIEALACEPDFAPRMPAVPNETIPPGNADTVRASAYGATTYGDLCNARQTLGFVRLCRVIAEMGDELIHKHHVSSDYASALVGYAGAVMARKLRRSTRGATLLSHRHASSNRVQIDHIFKNEAALNFSYDFFETGLGNGPGTWPSLCRDTLATLRTQLGRPGGRPARITSGSALSLPMRDASVAAVVTDPPYENMIDYSDASDLFFVWLKRALLTTHLSFSFTSDPHGVQEKTEEIIVKRGGGASGDHRTAAFYKEMLANAFVEARRVVVDDGVVTLVFGHGDPEVWHHLLLAITNAGLVLTGSWPARTERGGGAGSANIVTTLTMSCRPAPTHRPTGRANLVEAEVRREVRTRIPIWEAAGLAPTDQLMASAGPAMEVVGRYAAVLNNLGGSVQPDRYLIVARRAVEEAAAIQIDDLPLDAFDARTRFALSWARLYGRSVAPKSEARWQALASDLDLRGLQGVLTDGDKGVRFALSSEFDGSIDDASSVIDVVLGMAKAWPNGLDAIGEVLAASHRDADDHHVWAAITFFASRLPEADPDRVVWSSLVRNRRSVATASAGLVAAARHQAVHDVQPKQANLFDPKPGGDA